MTDVDYRATITTYGSIAAYEQSINRASAKALTHARRRILGALALLLAGSITWWLAPTGGADPRLQVTWTENGKSITTCGAPTSAAAGDLAIVVKDEDHPTVISLADVDEVKIVDSC
jgi:hypothetical protein